MAYQVEYSPRALKSLRKMDPHNRQAIYDWIGDNLIGCEDPYAHGKARTGKLKGLWRYRVGDWRVICDVIENKLVILVVDAGNRKTVYR